MCGFIKHPCPECGGNIAWYCGGDGVVGLVQCLDCSRIFEDVDKMIIENAVDGLEREREGVLY